MGENCSFTLGTLRTENSKDKGHFPQILQGLGQKTEGVKLQSFALVIAPQLSRPTRVPGTQQALDEGKWKNE